jgi:cytidine deaminase
MSVDFAKLIEAARGAREKAFAPFSGFKVGAAVETREGRVFTGCNVENASYGLTMCAERVAIFKAISEGEREFARICVIGDAETLTPPCGACRQIIWEFCGDAEIILANLAGDVKTFQMSELLPEAFDAKFLYPVESPSKEG